MALLVEHPVDRISRAPRRVLLDVSGRAQALSNKRAQMIGVVGSVRDDMVDGVEPIDQTARLRTIAPLPGRDRDPDRKAERIHGGMYLRGQAALRASDTGSFKPPF